MGLRAIALALVVLTASCSGRPRATEVRWSESHADSPGRRVPALSAGDARGRLDAAIAAADHRGAIIAANRLAVADAGAVTGADRAAVLAAVDRLRADQLPGVWDELDPPAFPSALVAFRRALVADHTGDPRAALAWLDRAAGAPELEARVATLRGRLRAAIDVEPERVAVLLPLSGPYRRIGAELRAAIELAATRHRDAELHFVDTEGDPARAAAAVDRAVREVRAVAILGPVGMRESAAAAARAAELQIPIALLSPEHHGAAPDVGVFRLWSSPGWEAREAVRVALAQGYDRLAILAPRDEQGGAQIAAFRGAATRAGATLVAAGQYDPTATDLEPDIKAFLGLDPRSNRRLARHLRRHGVKKGWKTFSPRVGFDLLFIPDDYQRAALVAAFLPYFNVELRTDDVIDIAYLKRKHGGRVPQVVQLLGSSGWHHPALIPRGGNLLDGALLIDVFSGSDDEEYATEAGAGFARDYQARFRRPATSVAAQAHDAALLVLSARKRAAAGGRPRAAMTRALAMGRIDDGACGPAAIGSDGEIRREAVVLRVEGGQFVVHDR